MTEDDTPEALEARCWALRERAERAEAGLKELAEACDKAKADRDKALAANKLLVEALKKIEKCSWREKIEKCSWHGYNTYDLGAMAHEALAAVKQP